MKYLKIVQFIFSGIQLKIKLYYFDLKPVFAAINLISKPVAG